MLRGSRTQWSGVALFVVTVLAWASEGAFAQFTGYVPPSSELIPMGTTKGQRYSRLIIMNATIVDGRGSPRANRGMPAQGPIDLIIENGVITNLILADPVNLGRIRDRGWQERPGDHVIDAAGMYVLAGLYEMHAHLPSPGGTGVNAEYLYRQYLGHGVTTVRDAGTGAGMEVMREQRRLSAANEIVAPRLVLCQRWPLPLRRWDVGHTPEEARLMVRKFKELGADCVKISRSPGHYPDVMEAATDEAKKLGMHVMVDLKVSETDAVVASNAGVKSIEHWYGVPDAALPGSQNFPPDYNYWEELDRFRWAGALWKQADQYPERLTKALEILIANGTSWNPTMATYMENRDFWRSRTLPWFETLAHPDILAGLYPDAATHGAYKTEWKTSDEIMWKENARLWMKWIKQFHDMGGILTAGSDEATTGGMAMIFELELLQETGIHPIDVVRIATTNAAKVLGWEKHCGIRVGCVADLAIVNGNPLDNFKVMYGRGYGFYGIVPREEQAKHGGVRWTIKEGIVFDAQALLKEVEWYVQQERRRLAAEDRGSGAGAR
ncbi:MAG: amidohydrolase family protein [Gemmatimonadetes bacterium]|nr:amidohydrolase family protein [Gemmatimonadota bacterium]